MTEAHVPAVAHRRSMASAAFGMGAWTAVSRTIGFVRVLVVAAVLGTTYLGNAFQAGNSISNVLFELLAAGALSAVLVPTFVHLLEAGNRAECERLAGSLLGLALVVLGVVTVVVAVGSPFVARLLTAGVDDPEIARQERALVAFLLPFFVPQVLLYAWGAVATGVLHAQRRFAVTAAAPIGSTVAMAGMILLFRWQRGGAAPSLHLSLSEKLTLAGAGTLGVVGFVGVLVVAAETTGFRLRPRFPRRLRSDAALGELARHSVAGVFLHATTGALLGAAIVAGGAVAGGVLAYQVAYVFFLAPYGILGQPVHTAVLPELASAARRGDDAGFRKALSWALDSLALLLVPVSVAFVVFAKAGMTVVAFGEARSGVGLLAAAVASLGIGLLPYSAFHLLARTFYARDDSRTPALASIAATVVGVAAIFVGAHFTHGTALVAALGLGHAAAYTVGTVTLWVLLGRRAHGLVLPTALIPAIVVSGVLGAAAWLALRAVDAQGRFANAAAVAVLGGLGGGLYVLAVRTLPVFSGSRRPARS